MFNDNIPFLGREDDDSSPAPQKETPEITGKAKIRVIGVGGAGNNAV